jgi:hypothetical protein
MRGRSEVLLRVPALRETRQIVFPDIGPMTDDEFIDLVRLALQSGYKVYVRALPSVWGCSVSIPVPSVVLHALNLAF